MTDARKPYVRLRNGGLILVALAGLALGYYGLNLRGEVREATPHLDGEPGALREVLAFPWNDYPSIPDVERKQLGELVPIDPPLRLSDVRPWLTLPNDPALGAAEARRNRELQAALSTMREIANKREAADPMGGDDPSSSVVRGQLSSAREHLAAAERSASHPMSWLISYNRGILYRWQGNRQKAAKEFTDAYVSLKRRLDGFPSEEAESAGIHILYGLGDSLLPEQTDKAPAIPEEAIDHLRQAVVLSVKLFASNPRGVAHAAEFFELQPTGLSTRALRNDLIVAYLLAPGYQICRSAMTDKSCSANIVRPKDPCGYRDKLFCETRAKASNRLSGVYKQELARYMRGETPQGTMWALQSVVELESENPLDEDAKVSYNVAYLLLNLKRPDLAYDYIAAVTGQGDGARPSTHMVDQTKVDEKMERLAFVTSILSGAKPTAMSESNAASDQQPSEYRMVYKTLYADKEEPEPFRPLSVNNEQKTKSLDAWLFIRRYRYLLARGQFETFVREHARLKQIKAPVQFSTDDFVDKWKKAVVVEFLQRVSKKREHAEGDSKRLIDRFLSREDLFTTSELQDAGLSRPFWSPTVSAVFRFVIGLITWIAFTAFYLWLCRAYRWTFLSAYREDREALERESREYA